MPQYFIYFLSPVVLLLFLAISVSNIRLMRHEGRSPLNMLGALTGFLFIVASVIITIGWDIIYEKVVFPMYCAGHFWIIAFDTGIPMFLSGVICYLECMFFGIALAQKIALRHKPSLDQDFVIVLGCQVAPDGKPYPLLRSRIDRAIEFAKEQKNSTGKDICYVPSGARGANECISEALSMKNYLVSKGTDESRILMDEQSTTTLENMKCSKKLIDARMPNAKVIFSTNNYHVFRSGIYAQQAGLKAEGIGAKTVSYFWPNALVREFIAVLFSHKKNHLAAILMLLVASATLGYITYLFR